MTLILGWSLREMRLQRYDRIVLHHIISLPQGRTFTRTKSSLEEREKKKKRKKKKKEKRQKIKIKVD